MHLYIPPHHRSLTAGWRGSLRAWPYSSPHLCDHPARPRKAWQTHAPAWWRSELECTPCSPQTDEGTGHSFWGLKIHSSHFFMCSKKRAFPLIQKKKKSKRAGMLLLTKSSNTDCLGSIIRSLEMCEAKFVIPNVLNAKTALQN